MGAPWNVEAYKRGGPFNAFICPSSGALSNMIDDGSPSDPMWPNNYVYCNGDALWALTGWQGHDYNLKSEPYVGDRTMFYLGRRNTLGHITDGTSNTVVPAGKYKIMATKFETEMVGPPPPAGTLMDTRPIRSYYLIDQVFNDLEKTPFAIEVVAGKNSFEPFDLGKKVRILKKNPLDKFRK